MESAQASLAVSIGLEVAVSRPEARMPLRALAAKISRRVGGDCTFGGGGEMGEDGETVSVVEWTVGWSVFMSRILCLIVKGSSIFMTG